MKINEKNLIKYATTPPFDLEGWLNKRSSNNSWRRRYCILKNNFFFYFDKKGENEPIGLIILENCTIELADELDGLSFQIVFDNRNLYTFAAENQDLMETWMKSLTSASYEYKKAMVLELQRQLNDINNQPAPLMSQHSLSGSQDIQPLSPQSQLQQLQLSTTNSPKPPPRRQNPFNRPAPAIPGSAPDSSNERSSNAPIKQRTNILPNGVGSGGGGDGNTNPLNNWETFSDEPNLDAKRNLNVNHFGNGLSSREQNQFQLDRQQQTQVVINENTENLFKTVHERFKKIISEDMCQYRNKKENLIKPLIIF